MMFDLKKLILVFKQNLLFLHPLESWWKVHNSSFPLPSDILLSATWVVNSNSKIDKPSSVHNISAIYIQGIFSSSIEPQKHFRFVKVDP